MHIAMSFFRRTKVPLVCWSALIGIAVAVYAIPDLRIAPPTPFSSQNEFLAGGQPFNGSILITSPAISPPELMPGRSGQTRAGYLTRAQMTNTAKGLGNFEINYPLTEARHGAGAVLARGPVPTDGMNPMPAPHDSTTYMYIVGGRGANGVTDTIERALIGADGHIHPGLETSPAGSLIRARYGAAVVARGDFIYIIGGYDYLDNPLDSIERVAIDQIGNLGPATEIAGPGWGGDVAAVIVNGYLYVIGGKAEPRAADEGALRGVARAAIDPRGDLLPFEDLADADAYLPVGTAGGRAFVIAGWMQGQPLFNIYYAGGNVGNLENGATGNVYRLQVNSANEVAGPWSGVSDATELVMLNDPRQLFAAVVSNGYVYAIGGESTAMGKTIYYSSVERAEVKADGSIGRFTLLDTYINSFARASDIHGIALNNFIYVPGGRDSVGDILDVVFDLDLAQPGALLEQSVSDAGLLSAIHDLKLAMEIDSLSFDIDPDPARSGGILFRFRLADESGGWGDWSGFVTIDALPRAIKNFGWPVAQGDRHLLDLTYAPGLATDCSGGVIPNPTIFQGPVAARYIEYEVAMPSGDKTQRFNALTINASPIMRFGVPGGYDPAFAGQAHPPSCSPNHAIADAGTVGWLRFEGVGLPIQADDGCQGQLRFTANPPNPQAPDIRILRVVRHSSSVLEIEAAIENKTGGPFDYDLEFDCDGPDGDVPFTMLMSPAVKVHPALRLHAAPAHGLDVNPDNATPNENVVAAPAKGLKSDFPSAILGLNLRSGRVNETGPVATDDATAASAWPRNPAVSEDEQPSYLRYKLEDKTLGEGFVPVKLSGAGAGEWRNAAPGDLLSDTRLLISLEVDHKAKSGPHDLEITVQNPQLGSTDTVRQTLYIVPALGVSSFKTMSDPTPDPNPGQGNQYDWTGALNPAVADLGDGVQTPSLTIAVEGEGFQSDTGNPLVLSVSSATPAYGPAVGSPVVLDAAGFQFDAVVPGNTMPGRHDVTFVWKYEPGISDVYDADAQAPPVRDPATIIERTWQRESDSWKGLYIVPPRVEVHSLLGSSNTQSPIVLLQSDPTITVNGVGFAIGGPTTGFGSVLEEARLISMANSPVEDIVVAPAGTHMVSDCQARLTMQIEADQRPGEMYQLEMKTKLPDVPASSKIRDPYSVGLSSQMVTVLPMPQCETVSVACFAAPQGGSLTSVQIIGKNFDSGTKVDFGPGVTVSNLDVCHDDPGRGCTTQDRLTFDLAVSALAAPGRRTVEIENGPTSSISQRASCPAQHDLWVVPAPTLSSIQPASIPQPPASVGTRRVAIDIYGTNFTTPDGMEIIPSSSAVVPVGRLVVVDSGHITTELLIKHTGQDGTYTLRVSEPAGPTCSPALPNPTVQGEFQVTAFREIAISAVVEEVSQCQGLSGTLQVTGSNFRDPAGTPLVATASLGPDISIESMTIGSDGTSMSIRYTISESASPGKRTLTLEPVLEGATPAVLANALTITSSPVLQSISPRAFNPGDEEQVTIIGRNFISGAKLQSPSTDIEFSNVTVVNSGQILATVEVDAEAAPGLFTVTLDNADGACSIATLNAGIQIIDPPHVTSWKFKKGKLRINGMNFHPSMQAYVGGSTSPYPYLNVAGNARVILEKAKAAFPKGIATTVRLVNPDDGGEVTITVTRN